MKSTERHQLSCSWNRQRICAFGLIVASVLTPLFIHLALAIDPDVDAAWAELDSQGRVPTARPSLAV